LTLSLKDFTGLPGRAVSPGRVTFLIGGDNKSRRDSG
jgi:hypothetical protein